MANATSDGVSQTQCPQCLGWMANEYACGGCCGGGCCGGGSCGGFSARFLGWVDAGIERFRNLDMILSLIMLVFEAFVVAVDIIYNYHTQAWLSVLSTVVTVILAIFSTRLLNLVENWRLEHYLQTVLTVALGLITILQALLPDKYKKHLKMPLSYVAFLVSITCFIFHLVKKDKETFIECRGERYNIRQLQSRDIPNPADPRREICVFVCACRGRS